MSDLEDDELGLESGELEDDGTKDFEGNMEDETNFQPQVLKMITVLILGIY